MKALTDRLLNLLGDLLSDAFWQAAIGSFAGALATSFVALALLSIECKIDVSPSSDGPANKRGAFWQIKSTGANAAHIVRIEGSDELVGRLLAPGAVANFEGYNLGGRIYYRRFKWYPFNRFATYGDHPDALRSKSKLRRLYEDGIGSKVHEFANRKFPKLHFAWHLGKALSFSGSSNYELKVWRKDRGWSVSLLDSSSSANYRERTLIDSFRFTLPVNFVYHIARNHIATKPTKRMYDLDFGVYSVRYPSYKWSLSRRDLLALKRYLYSIQSQLDYLRFRRPSSPTSILDFLDDNQDLARKVKSVTERGQYSDSQVIAIHQTRNKHLDVGEIFSVKHPRFASNSDAEMLLKSWSEWSLFASTKKSRRYRQYLFVNKEGLAIYMGDNNPHTIKCELLHPEELEKLKSRLKSWKYW